MSWLVLGRSAYISVGFARVYNGGRVRDSSVRVGVETSFVLGVGRAVDMRTGAGILFPLMKRSLETNIFPVDGR